MPTTTKGVALDAVRDIARRIATTVYSETDGEVHLEDAQALFNATVAAMELGATTDEAYAAMRSVLTEDASC